MVVFNHFLGPSVGHHAYDIASIRIFHCFLYVAVNCFVLISGYFLIKLKLKSFTNLYITCAFYGLLGYIIHIIRDGDAIGRSLVYNSVFVFSHNTWWFIHAYIGLMLLSPLLNIAIENLNKRQFLIAISGLVACNMYFGWFWHATLFTKDGFAISQFVQMYLIGAFIRKYIKKESILQYKWPLLFSYIGFTVMMGVWQELHLHFQLSNLDITDNNSPLAICCAISLFCFFLSLSMQSKSVNYIAKSSLSVYLIHCQSYISIIIFGAMNNMLSNMDQYSSWFTPYKELGFAFVGAIVVFVASIAIDQLRILLMKPFWFTFDFISAKCENSRFLKSYQTK